MNINRISQIYQVYKSESTKKVDKANGVASAKDVVNISKIPAEAKEFQNAFTAAMKSEDMRDDLVKDIKQKIDNGEYEMNTDDLVDKIVKKKH